METISTVRQGGSTTGTRIRRECDFVSRLTFWMKTMVLLVVLGWNWISFSETIPSKPASYFNDYAGKVSPGVVHDLNEKLAQFERDTSDQILVVIYPQMDSESSPADYTVRIARQWKVGQADKKNGAILFIFDQQHQIYIQVGYGLEAVLTDFLSKQIIENEIKPYLRQGNYNAAMTAGVNAMMGAVRGEYKGTGRTVRESNRGSHFPPVFILLAVIIFFLVIGRSSRRGVSRSWISPGGYYSSSGFNRDSGSSGNSGSSGFSSGGGDFGGGGAGGSW